MGEFCFCKPQIARNSDPEERRDWTIERESFFTPNKNVLIVQATEGLKYQSRDSVFQRI